MKGSIKYVSMPSTVDGGSGFTGYAVVTNTGDTGGYFYYYAYDWEGRVVSGDARLYIWPGDEYVENLGTAMPNHDAEYRFAIYHEEAGQLVLDDVKSYTVKMGKSTELVFTFQSDRAEGEVGDEFLFSGVLSEGGVPIPGMEVVLVMADGPYVGDAGIEVGSTYTDENGYWQVPWLGEEPGFYVFSATARISSGMIGAPSVNVVVAKSLITMPPTMPALFPVTIDWKPIAIGASLIGIGLIAFYALVKR